MSSTIPGLPIGSDVPRAERQIRFDHVPKLRELIPNGGWPGVVYAQVLIHNLKAAADREERPAHLSRITSSFYYSIDGPKGSAQMALVGCGQRIPGAAPEGGERLFFTDGEVEVETGHPVGEYVIWFSQAPPREVVQAMPLPGSPGAAAGADSAAPRVKRKYTRKKPWDPKRRGQLDQARKLTQHRKTGHYTAKEPAHGSVQGAQAAEDRKDHVGVQGGHAAQRQQDWPQSDQS